MGRLWKKFWKFGAIVAAIALIPTAALAATGTFTSNTTTPAVAGVNTSSLAGAAGVLGHATDNGANARYGVQGVAAGSGGIGVFGLGPKYGVFSAGTLGVASGKYLSCVAATGCVGPTALTTGSVTSTKLAASSVGTSALQNGSVSAAKLDASARAIQPLGSGESESGIFVLSGQGTTPGYLFYGPITFVRPIPGYAGLTVSFGPSINCLGGSAAPGYLCIYEESRDVASTFHSALKISADGGSVVYNGGATGSDFATGRWAATQP